MQTRTNDMLKCILKQLTEKGSPKGYTLGGFNPTQLYTIASFIISFPTFNQVQDNADYTVYLEIARLTGYPSDGPAIASTSV